MIIPINELYAVLYEFNPWWMGRSIEDLPEWRRSAAEQIWRWVQDRETPRGLLLEGARQVGKTTLFRQTIHRLIEEGFNPKKIIYLTFDHPILKLTGLEKTLQVWRDLFPETQNEEQYLFLDEVQFLPDWQTWLKHQSDFHRHQKIAVTGSANPLREATVESGVGRWETLPLSTLSFKEYLRLRKTPLLDWEGSTSLKSFMDWSEVEFQKTAHRAKYLTGYFHEYLLRGGFPEPAMVSDLTRCQRLLREDIVEKVLKRDITALYGVRKVIELEKLFLYLCYHDGGILDVPTVSKEMEGIGRQQINNFLDLLESTFLIYRLRQWGYGKEILRGRWKIYLSDPALAGAVLLKGKRLFEQKDCLGAAVEAAVFKHLYTRYYPEQPRFSYWRGKGKKEYEVDLIAEIGDRVIPFEVKYQDSAYENMKLHGLYQFMREQKIDQGYLVQQRWEDFGVHRGKEESDPKILKIPAPLACYLLSE